MPDLSPYVGRWVALVRGHVVGVGQSADEARHMATQNRPKEKHCLLFVSPQVQVARAAEQQPMIQTVFDLAKAQSTSVYLVGGSVRDLLLGTETHDLDFAVHGDGLKLARYIADELCGAFVALDQRRKTGRVILLPEALHLDFATLRGSDLCTDLRGRDFTINAMALERTPEGKLCLVDPLDGSVDLANRVLRAALPTSFASDPVRMLRAVRLQAQFGCKMEPETRAWLEAAAPQLRTVSAERIRDEWFSILEQPTASSALRELHRLGLLYTIAPPLAAMEGLEQSPPHHFDGLAHAFETVRAVELLWRAFSEHTGVQVHIPDALHAVTPQVRERYQSPICDERTYLALLKCAALLHDIGKPKAKQVGADGRIRFIGHEHAGAKMAGALARGWHCSNSEVSMLRAAIEAHMRPVLLAQEPSLTRRAIYRFYRDTGAFGVDAGFLALADCLATWGPDLPAERWERQVETVATLWAAYFEQKEAVVEPPPLLSGNDLIALGVSPGRKVGELLERVREAQAAGELDTREEALARVAEWLTQTTST
jgi:putative nucleotidyltransferase with HDIG domain